MFIDELILLTGTWLLARRFFDVPATCFVALSVVASAVWLDQPYWNFRLHYAVPLVLELGHRFLDTGRWRWAFLTANLLALQTIGNLPYLIPLTSFVVFTYFTCYSRRSPIACSWIDYGPSSGNARAATAMPGGALSFAAAYACVTLGTEQLVDFNVGRSQTGTTSLSFFLSFGGFTDLRKWNDLVLRISPGAGQHALWPECFWLLCCGRADRRRDRRRVHLVLTAALLLLFTLSTPLSRLVYYAWPGMWYFRHIGLVSSLVKVLFCFVAGIGFESLFKASEWGKRAAIRAVAIVGAIGLGVGAWWAMNTASSATALNRYVSSITVVDACPITSRVRSR